MNSKRFNKKMNALSARDVKSEVTQTSSKNFFSRISSMFARCFLRTNANLKDSLESFGVIVLFVQSLKEKISAQIKKYRSTIDSVSDVLFKYFYEVRALYFFLY